MNLQLSLKEYQVLLILSLHIGVIIQLVSLAGCTLLVPTACCMLLHCESWEVRNDVWL